MNKRQLQARLAGLRASAARQAAKAEKELASRNIRDVIKSLKNETASTELFRSFPRTVKNRSVLSNFYGQPFPKEPADIHAIPRQFAPAPTVNELIWATAYTLQYCQEVHQFVVRREALERAILINDRETALGALDEIQNDLGWSIWLMQNRLSAIQLWDGLDEKRKLSRIYEDQVKDNDLVAMLLGFVSSRTEGTSVPGYLQSELARLFPNAPKTHLQAYLKTKLFDLASPELNLIGITLSFEAQSCVVDYYETLVSLLQAVAADEEASRRWGKFLVHPITVLLSRTQDRRLVPVVLALDGEPKCNVSEQKERAAFIDAYSEGNYPEAVRVSAAYLVDHPSDISAFTLHLRAELRLGSEPTAYAGLLGDIARHLRTVIALSADAYASALSLYTIYDRFYGHAWATYLRAIVMLELAQDQFEYPSDAMRRVLSLDPNLSPFSSLLEQPSSAFQLGDVFCQSNAFEATLQVFELATTGQLRKIPCTISEERRRRYIGRFHLSNGNFLDAVSNFSWCRDHLRDGESFRCATAAVVAHIRSGDLSSAISETVSAYANWPHVPTILPLQTLVTALETPETWPDSISLPLVFELYFSFVSNDRIADLRYAFERFQTQAGIASPSDLRERMDEFGRESVILYLSRVWRPEVMRQTILYDGTREIEEERIRVCRVLAEIDSNNAPDYLTEIRERVKAQELAKATNLVEQSRVYVDIGAIKKALRTRLGDAYARYKVAMQNVPVTENALVDQVAGLLSGFGAKGESLTAVMSRYHVVTGDSSNSELDVQFAAMFAEVTNEFLKGEHGLNAYLSTRVRHGKLSNALRKPVADECLVTERKEGTNDYVENTYWNDHLTDLDEEELSRVLAILGSFAANIDAIIAYVRDQLIQVAIVHERVAMTDNHSALFVYRTSNLERMFVQTSDRRIKHIDDFINLCVETLWEKTDANLVEVQKELHGGIRSQFLFTFDTLTESLVELNYSDRLGDLFNHIGRARTNIQTKISTVASWFKRSEVYDRQDYAIDFPVLIARSMIENSISGASGWDGIRVKIDGDQSMMPGRTLDGMVDVFCGIFENSISYSGFNIDKLFIDVDLKFSDGVFSARVRNPIEALTFQRRDEEKLDRIRAEIKKSDARHRAQKDKGSGFHKLWATINAPQYSNPSLEFMFSDDRYFEVKLSFEIEVMDDEDSTH
jgi:hypothetical protein